MGNTPSVEPVDVGATLPYLNADSRRQFGIPDTVEDLQRVIEETNSLRNSRGQPLEDRIFLYRRNILANMALDLLRNGVSKQNESFTMPQVRAINSGKEHLHAIEELVQAALARGETHVRRILLQLLDETHARVRSKEA